jgi:hypothetical protein
MVALSEQVSERSVAMFERDRVYPCAVTCNGAERPEEAQEAAIHWIGEQHRDVGGTILLFAPQKGDLKRMDNHIARLADHPDVGIGTWKGFIHDWSGGPVLAAWPSRAKLGEIADDRRTRALCVIPWNADETAAWEQAFHPVLLAGASPRLVSHGLDPVVVAGLSHLTRSVNLANNLAGALDRRDAVAVLRVLHKGGYALPGDQVYAWALGHGWPSRGAERLREMAEKIDAGRTMQLKGAWPFRDDILDTWKSSARKSGHA